MTARNALTCVPFVHVSVSELKDVYEHPSPPSAAEGVTSCTLSAQFSLSINTLDFFLNRVKS